MRKGSTELWGEHPLETHYRLTGIRRIDSITMAVLENKHTGELYAGLDGTITHTCHDGEWEPLQTLAKSNAQIDAEYKLLVSDSVNRHFRKGTQ